MNNDFCGCSGRLQTTRGRRRKIPRRHNITYTANDGHRCSDSVTTTFEDDDDNRDHTDPHPHTRDLPINVHFMAIERRRRMNWRPDEKEKNNNDDDDDDEKRRINRVATSLGRVCQVSRPPTHGGRALTTTQCIGRLRVYADSRTYSWYINRGINQVLYMSNIFENYYCYWVHSSSPTESGRGDVYRCAPSLTRSNLGNVNFFLHFSLFVFWAYLPRECALRIITSKYFWPHVCI